MILLQRKSSDFRYPDTNIYIYTVETAEPQAILDKVHNQFNVDVDREKINFIRLTMRRAIEAKSYPYFTLLLQSLGSMVLAMEAFMKLNPGEFYEGYFKTLLNYNYKFWNLNGVQCKTKMLFFIAQKDKYRL